jgi:uncharacterized cupredoxin-like copper-binding protein
MWKRSRNLTALGVAVLLVTAACASSPEINGAGTDQAAATEKAPTVEASGDYGRVIEVEMTEFAFAADSFEFSPGETVEFLVTNSGVVEHELRLSNQVRVDEHLAGGHDDDDHDDEREAGAEADHDEAEADHNEAEADDIFVVLDAGETGTLVFTFPDNDHDYTGVVCLLPGHYEAGMATDLSYQT